MPRGFSSEIGETRVSANGYQYTKTATGWKLTHHITAEKMLGRPLSAGERVEFVSKRAKDDPENPNSIRITTKGSGSVRRRGAIVEAQIEEYIAELNSINDRLGRPRVKLIELDETER